MDTTSPMPPLPAASRKLPKEDLQLLLNMREQQEQSSPSKSNMRGVSSSEVVTPPAKKTYGLLNRVPHGREHHAPAIVGMSITDIYNDDRKFIVEKSVVIILKKMVRRHIFPMAKFVTHRNSFDRPLDLDTSYVGHVMKSMGWKDCADTEKAVY